MSGHSKWSTIKHKKAAADARRGKVFTRITKELVIAAREGGADPDSNVRLRLAVDKARAANMPKENIERAIKRGTGEIEGGEIEEATYEGYGPHGVGILVEVVTDNRNRAIAEVRHAFNKHGGNMAEAGAVAWQFTRKGYISIADGYEPDELFLLAAEAGAEDVSFEDGLAEITTEMEALHETRSALEAAGYTADEVSLFFEPNNPLALAQNEALAVLRLVEALEELDDVQEVSTTLDLDAETLAALEAA
ncbi:MAG: YebC/PmpR family DNA-binding transcriptional regulator [Candidatus Promineifilaceae bacterium]